jgi:hypothetical protein
VFPFVTKTLFLLLYASRPHRLTHGLHAFGVAGMALGLLCAPSFSHACSSRAVPLDSIAAPLDGKVQQAFTCNDAEGTSIYVETRGLTGAGSIKPGTIMVTFYKFQQTADGRWLTRWQARDFVPITRQMRLSRNFTITVKDVDGDKIDEAFISYSLPSDEQRMEDGKLLVYYKDKKFAVRGAVGMQPGDFSSRSVDAGFESMPAAVQRYALSLWDKVAVPVAITFNQFDN